MVLVGAMQVVGAVIRGRVATGDSALGAGTGHAVDGRDRGELTYIEPASPPSFGREASENNGKRTNWDDVDDYYQWNASPPQDRNGNALPNTSGWKRTASVEWVDPSNPAATVGSDQGLKRITVTVQRNGQVLAKLVALKSDQDSGTGP